MPAPSTLPEGVAPRTPRKLINHPDLEIPWPTVVGMAGFIALWGCVAGLIAFVFYMAGWGT